IARRLLTAFAERVVEQLPTFAGDTRRLLHRLPEAHELARKVVERWLHLPSQCAAMVREEQISDGSSDYRTDNRGRHCPRVVHRPSYRNRSSYKLYATYAIPIQPRRLVRSVEAHVGFSDAARRLVHETG